MIKFTQNLRGEDDIVKLEESLSDSGLFCILSFGFDGIDQDVRIQKGLIVHASLPVRGDFQFESERSFGAMLPSGGPAPWLPTPAHSLPNRQTSGGLLQCTLSLSFPVVPHPTWRNDRSHHQFSGLFA